MILLYLRPGACVTQVENMETFEDRIFAVRGVNSSGGYRQSDKRSFNKRGYVCKTDRRFERVSDPRNFIETFGNPIFNVNLCILVAILYVAC